MLCLYLYLIFIPPKDGLFAMPFISWLSSTYLFQTYSFYIHMLFSQSSLQNADLTDNTGAETQASNYHGLSRSRSFCLWPAWSQYNRLRYRCCRNNEIHAPLFFHLAVKNCYAFPQAQYIRT